MTPQGPISVVLVPELKAIIDKWDNLDKHPDNYVFAVYDDTMSALRKHDLSVPFIRVIIIGWRRFFKSAE
ncbi:hypothetical protein DN068_20305 [Taibaiella soli]|uniref:Uncharacterized protein n=1 Tax=Taibaiella soli TaxID=1649169 RepID=A0A2W2ASW2_9BACT|nr:hypothetical protein DN068_20305 [Taibaiella soli]